MEKTEEKKIKPRKKIVAFLFSLLVPGLGQLYNGETKKAPIFFSVLLLLIICISISEIYIHYTLLIISVISFIIFRLIAAIEAFLSARRKKNFQPKGYNQWYIYVGIILFCFFFIPWVGEATKSNSRYKLFKASSDSGVPAFNIGDYVVGDLRFYNSQEPIYGDLVIYAMPDGNQFIHRIVGMPGDTLSIENYLVKYKNRNYKSELISESTYEGLEVEVFLETLPNGAKYKIYRSKFPHLRDESTVQKVVVPQSAYFLLGDNRNHSFDSKMVGFIKREQIQGKVLTAYSRKNLKKINKKLYLE